MRPVVSVVALALIGAGESQPKSSEITWHWDREAIGCELDQRLESASVPVSISRNPGTDETHLGLRVRSPKFWKGYYPAGTITLSNGKSFAARVQVYSAENRSYQLWATITDPSFVNALADTSSISISEKDFGHFDAPVRDTRAAMDALHACEDTYLKLWGVDSAALAALQSRPVPMTPLQEAFTGFDYPGIGLAGQMGADIIAKLEVGEDGAVRSCTWLGPKDLPQFGDAICKGLKERARFQPARNASGQPVSAPYVTVAKFRMASY